jgi:hypothetical protein
LTGPVTFSILSFWTFVRESISLNFIAKLAYLCAVLHTYFYLFWFIAIGVAVFFIIIVIIIIITIIIIIMSFDPSSVVCRPQNRLTHF